MKRLIILVALITLTIGYCFSAEDHVYITVGEGESTYTINQEGDRVNLEALKSTLQGSFYYDDVIYPEMTTIEKEMNGQIVETPAFLFGVKNYKDEIIALPDNDKVIENSLGYMLVNGERAKQIDVNGETLSTTKFELPKGSRIVDIKEDCYIYEIATGGQGRIDKEGKIIEPAKAARITYLDETIIHYHVNMGLHDEEKKGVYGVQIKDVSNGKVLVDLAAGTMGHKINDHLYAGRNSAGQWYLIDYDGQVVSKRPVSGRLYINIGQESEGLISFSIRGEDGASKWGYMDQNEKIIIAPQFTHAMPFKNSFAIVDVAGKKGMINRSGKYVILPELDKIYTNVQNNQKFYCVKLGDYSGVMDSNFNWVVAPRLYAYANLTEDGIYIVKRTTSGNVMGLLSLTGETIIPCKYKEISKFTDNEFILNNSKKSMLFDVTSGAFTDLPYLMARNAGHQYLSVSNDGQKWGISTSRGQLVTEMKYDRVGMFRNYSTQKIQ